MTADTLFALTLLVSSSLTAFFFGYLYTVRRQPFLTLWSAAWLLLALHSLSPAMAPWAAIAPWQSAMDVWLLAAAALLFFSTARSYTDADPWFRIQTAAGGVFLVWSVAYYLRFTTVSPLAGAALVMLGTAWIFYQESRRQETFADLLLAISFAGWAAALIAQLIADPAENWVRALGFVPQMSTAPLMVMAIYEEEKRRIERNMLALSNVNLVTSSLVGVEIQKMLSHALERVMSVVRMPAGALFLHHGDPQGATSVVAVGLGESFCAAAQQEGLDDHMVDLVSRLGGLVVFRDLGKDSSWAALENEEAFRRFRKLALRHSLQTVVAISLQAKEQAFGVLFLGSSDVRPFAAAELRLLLALGHQIGMSVENSYLIQQSSRRSEELHVLNQIGRALSSTLDPEALCEIVLLEMKRLFDAGDFFIALHEPQSNEMRFEVEVRDGVTLPKRSPPAADRQVSEYVMRTRQPLLVRENYADELTKIGVESIPGYASLCCVPLLLNEQAIGIMAVQSRRERAFDNGHLEIMRVLASEMVIALENARLFREERSKSRHLALLNNVSRNVIKTLNPDEMLAKIAETLDQDLDFYHLGIALLDYSRREVVIHAEAGRRDGAMGRRLQFTGNILGQVARTGQMATIHYSDLAQENLEPVLSGSLSAQALPILYADHLHGVLYVESDEAAGGSEEETLFLRTLADLVAGALHNAIAFQKAQDQAITDGLTGVKTHRFFMEALSGEWKRSTRAGRSFSLVLLDLDRFKFVNDFYGHLDGDMVLQRVAHVLDQNCRRSDVVARYGGDEFLILMPETDGEQAQQIATKIRTWISTDPMLREKNVTASFGVACFPADGSTPQELIQAADASMYLAKHQGGNAVATAEHFNPDETKKWKKDVLEAYLGVTLKRLFTTGPDAFVEIYNRIEQFARSLGQTEGTPPAKALAPSCVAPAEPLPSAVMDTLTSLALAVDSKDQFTQGHSQKVSGYAVLIAEAKGLDPLHVEAIRLGGMLHDVGKVGIPADILNKSGPLNPEQWETMKRHVEYGSKLLEPLRGTQRIRDMVNYHHEFYDGSGYPEGLAGNQIPLGARIVAIADAYDTITTERTYKTARTAEEAFVELERCAGTQFDPELIQLLITSLQRLPKPLLDETSALEVLNSEVRQS